MFYNPIVRPIVFAILTPILLPVVTVLLLVDMWRGKLRDYEK